jgi:hypothetical protein
MKLLILIKTLPPDTVSLPQEPVQEIRGNKKDGRHLVSYGKKYPHCQDLPKRTYQEQGNPAVGVRPTSAIRSASNPVMKNGGQTR